MNIRHCLFWFQNGTVTAVLKKSSGMEILRFRGDEAVLFTDGYWEQWIDYAGLCGSDKADLCFIYDSEPAVPEELLSRQCDPSDGIWSGRKIEKVLKMLNISEPAEVRTESGERLCRVGPYRSARSPDIRTMTARFVSAETETDGIGAEPAEMTPIVRHYVKKLEEYEESQKR